MRRLAAYTLILLCSTTAQGHHWVKDVYDSRQRFIVEVEVLRFQLIHPHPLMRVEITGFPGDAENDDLEVGQTWTLEMDNKRELTALGFDNETFVPGDKITVVVNPSQVTFYRDNTMYLRAVEHRRKGFVYLHNVRQLFPAEPGENNLERYLDEIN